MKSVIKQTKEGEQLKTKEGELMYEHTFEVGDEFIPQINTVLEKTHEADVKGKKKTITEYSMPCVVKVKGEVVKDEKGGEVHFMSLTPTQAKSLKKKLEAGTMINQHVFIAYEYENDFGKQVGVGIKAERKEPITFE